MMIPLGHIYKDFDNAQLSLQEPNNDLLAWKVKGRDKFSQRILPSNI
jgi:hypothetical protein